MTDAYWQAASAADGDDELTFCCLADVIGPGEAGYGNRCACGGGGAAGGGGGDGQWCCLALSRRLAMLLLPLEHCVISRTPALYR